MLNFIFPDLTHRSTAPELMDLPDSDERKLRNTLRLFKITNWLLSRSRALLTHWVLADMRPGRAYTLLDLGAGSCDLPIWLVKACRQRGLSINITCLELDPRTARFAREQCLPYPELTVAAGSALDLAAFPAYDYVFANHFLHHVPTGAIPGLLDAVAQKTKRRFLLNDLKRSAWAYAAFTLFAWPWAPGSFTYTDGRLSILKGFTLPEVQAMLAQCTSRERIFPLVLFPSRLALAGAGTELRVQSGRQ